MRIFPSPEGVLHYCVHACSRHIAGSVDVGGKLNRIKKSLNGFYYDGLGKKKTLIQTKTYL